MAEHKAGLHKKISSIFGGTPIPNNNGDRQSDSPPNLSAEADTEEVLTRETAQRDLPQANTEDRRQKSEDRRQKTEVRRQKTEDRRQESEDRRQKTEVRRQKTEGRRQKAEDRRQKSEDRRQIQEGTAASVLRYIRWQQTQQWIQNKLSALKQSTGTTRQKIMVVLIPAFSIVLIFVFIRLFNTPSPQGPESVAFEPVSAAAGSNNKINWQIPELYPTTLRDPMEFNSTKTTQGPGSGLTINGIMYSEDNPTAVIGGEIVHEGDKVSDVTVIKINKDSVELERDGKRWTQKVQR